MIQEMGQKMVSESITSALSCLNDRSTVSLVKPSIFIRQDRPASVDKKGVM